MPQSIPHLWTWFYVCLTGSLLTAIVMAVQGRRFHYFDGKVKKFSMFMLEFPPDRYRLYFIFRQISALPQADADQTRRALKTQLYTDFLYMLFTYPGIALICRAVMEKYQGQIQHIFGILCWIQLLCWVLDIAENLYLLGQSDHPALLSRWQFLGYRLLELLKWLPALGGFLAALLLLNLH